MNFNAVILSSAELYMKSFWSSFGRGNILQDISVSDTRPTLQGAETGLRPCLTWHHAELAAEQRVRLHASVCVCVTVSVFVYANALPQSFL